MLNNKWIYLTYHLFNIRCSAKRPNGNEMLPIISERESKNSKLSESSTEKTGISKDGAVGVKMTVGNP